MVKLPADLFCGGVCSVWRSETSGIRGIRSGAERMGAHMADGCGLSGRPSGCCGCRIAYLACGNATREAATDSLRDIKIAA